MQINEDETAVLRAIADLVDTAPHGVPNEDDVARWASIAHDEVVEIMRYLESRGLIKVLFPTVTLGGVTITDLGRRHL
ncbi:hypothetical protein [Streptomyces erythrochromogenes]|uniref:hypothetical protein n=1 Tax=Streptomyces erythrochromogenes TaxID=285574 RepID=UPI00386E12D5|nr:hypothetical protein OG364_27065 [Streptomyces erythrochromogenes]